MHTFAELAHALNRSPVYLRGLQARFVLPVLEGAAYADMPLPMFVPRFLMRVSGLESLEAPREEQTMRTAAGSH